MQTQLHSGDALADRLDTWRAFAAKYGSGAVSCDPAWLLVFRAGCGQTPYMLEAVSRDGVQGILPLCLLESRLFGRFLVSLPYLNSGGVLAAGHDGAIAAALIDQAVQLAAELDVRYLELRHEQQQAHPALTETLTSKVHMRLDLPETGAQLRATLKSSVRNQVKKGESQGFTVHWGGKELLPAFHGVLSRRMRELGTPVFGKALFGAILDQFPDRAEFCIVREGSRPISAALLLHGDRVTEVPSASALARYNPRNVNMLMYWHLLCRAVERGSGVFDFGRSTVGSGTYRFKKQWGAEPAPAVWQYHVRKGDFSAMRPDNSTNQRLSAIWRRLPLWLTRFAGPRIVRGIP